MWVPTVLITLLSTCYTGAQIQNLKLVVNGDLKIVPLKHFWQSTGFCPPSPHQGSVEFDLSEDMVQNLAFLGALPHSAVQQVRIHWLLDLVTVFRISGGRPDYNFTGLDRLLDLLHGNGLRPGFELMGSPSGIFTDMENKTQLYWWRDLVTQLAKRYIDRYGLDYVKQWNFETWNEPDCHDFDETKMTVQGFQNYYDACSEGLKAASPLLVFGGPADGCDHSDQAGKAGRSNEYREALFGHVVNGTNYFTGEKGVRLDFISLHRKGSGEASNIIDDELKAMEEIRQRYPELANKPFYNDEADPEVGWSKEELWRATTAYAAMVIKVICQHQNILLGTGKAPPINYTLLSNDNAFLSFYPHHFTQRTLLARFQMNGTTNNSISAAATDHSRKDTSSGTVRQWSQTRGKGGVNYVTFIRKPIYAAMALLAKLGEIQVPSALLDQKSGSPLANTSYAGSLVSLHIPHTPHSSDSMQWSAVVYWSSDTSLPTHWGTLTTDWRISARNATDLMLAVYSIDDKTTNPYIWWDYVFGRPDFPSLKQFETLRKNEGPSRLSLTRVTSDPRGVVSIPPLDFQEPQVLLIHLCDLPPSPPEQVTGVRMLNITAGQVLVLWSDSNIHTKCIKTFEVEHRMTNSTAFIRINAEDTIVNLFVYATAQDSQVRGEYRVRAVDYWQRTGPYSPVLPYPTPQ